MTQQGKDCDVAFIFICWELFSNIQNGITGAILSAAQYPKGVRIIGGNHLFAKSELE